MKPYGVKNIGAVCKYGCCFVQTTVTSPFRALRHGLRRPAKKRARQEARKAALETT